MTEQSNAELIAQLRHEGNEWSGKYGALFFQAADALEAADQRAKDAVSQRNRAYRQRGEEREAKEGNIRALNRVTGERDQLAAALEAAEQEKAEAWRVAAEQTRLERERAEAAEQRAERAEEQRDELNRMHRECHTQRDEYAAVVEKVRERLHQPIHPYGDQRIPEVPEHEFLADGYGEALPRDLFDILGTAPVGALREHDAALIEAYQSQIRSTIGAFGDADGVWAFDAAVKTIEEARQRREGKE